MNTLMYEVSSENNRILYIFFIFIIGTCPLQGLYSPAAPSATKQSQNVSFEMFRNAFDKFVFVFSMASKLHRFSTIFNFKNKKKSQAARSGE